MGIPTKSMGVQAFAAVQIPDANVVVERTAGQQARVVGVEPHLRGGPNELLGMQILARKTAHCMSIREQSAKSKQRHISTKREPDRSCGTHHPGRAGMAIQNLQTPTSPAAGDLDGVVSTAAEHEMRCRRPQQRLCLPLFCLFALS